MKKLFSQYYLPTSDEYASHWKEAIFVFDANVPYTAPTKEDPPFKNSAYNYAIPG